MMNRLPGSFRFYGAGRIAVNMPSRPVYNGLSGSTIS
jgi:hypothetical protein